MAIINILRKTIIALLHAGIFLIPPTNVFSSLSKAMKDW